ncbi:MAG: serine hydrolase domain-containing protein [Pseudomonadota bacterium]
MPILRILITFAIAAVFVGAATAQRPTLNTDRIAAIDEMIEARMEAFKIPGAALALIENGEVVHARGFGTIGDGTTPITADTKFQIGSISKPFTALAILHLVETGKLSLDDTLVSHVPTFQTRIAAQSDKITVRHLLSHRSGFSTVFGNRNQGPGAVPDTSVKDLLSVTRRTALQFEPGAAYAYSNANYQWLGYLAERVTERPFSEIFADSVAARYGLEQTRLGPSESSEGQTPGHRYWFGAARPYTWRPERVTWPQGVVQTTASDLAKLLTGLIDAFDRAELDPLLQAMVAPVPAEAEAETYYGLGWVIRQSPSPRIVYHHGLNPGFEAMAGFSPDERFGFVVLANASTSFGAANVSALGSGVVDLILDRELRPSTPRLAERIARMVVFALPVLLLLNITLFVWKWRREAFEPITLNAVRILLRLVLPTVFLIGMAYALYAIVPSLNGVNFQALYMFNPDIGLLLGFSSLLALAWGLVRPILRLRIVAG